MFDFRDRVALITGASRGIGLRVAQDFVESGAKVVLAARSVTRIEKEVKALQGFGEASALALDVTDGASIQSAVKDVVGQFGKIDILVNNAAVYANLTSAPFDKLTEDEWDRCMAVNVKGVWNCCRAVAPTMRENGGGSIINMASLAATYGLPFCLHYPASKAAVIGITRGLARELGRHWIRVNAIAPSAVDTERTRDFFGDKFEHATETIRANQSLRRTLEPSDIAGQVIYLASDASRFVTGQTLMVDGGTTLL